MVEKYKVLRFVGVPVVQNQQGEYEIKKDPQGGFKLHEWRIGKHTNGKFTGVGQVFLTENQMRVAIILSDDVSFKKRHQFTPMARFLTETVSETVLKEARQKLNGEV
ncbi:hypothetical protein R4B61_03040 [Fructilactobacillus vespulae]|uniref:DUF7671 family protein n=1 Tax=Fructilactobacillus vespulae TaxID=1249630 RepID=UPI0039B65434